MSFLCFNEVSCDPGMFIDVLWLPEGSNCVHVVGKTDCLCLVNVLLFNSLVCYTLGLVFAVRDVLFRFRGKDRVKATQR